MFTAEEAASIVKCRGLILYGMAMIFTSLKKFENGEAATRIVCTDEDFNTALRLAEIYLHHSSCSTTCPSRAKSPSLK